MMKLVPTLSLALLSACVSAPAPKRVAEKIKTTVALPAPGVAREPASENGWQLVWSDEFDGPDIDRTKWDFDVDCWGGGNNERQCYTDDPRNAAIEEGALVIMARAEQHSGPALPPRMRKTDTPVETATKPYTSARLVTRGKAAWRYGRIEVRAKLPSGQGTWPAIWMLPEDPAYGSWASSGEIDILEAVNLGVPCANCPSGRDDTILGTLHFGGQWPNNAFDSTETHAPDVLGGFHTFGVVWAPGQIEWTYDGRVYATKHAGDWWSAGSKAKNAPFDRPFHLILNLAIGGGLAEERGLGGVDPTRFPKRLEVDWVRVWQCAPSVASTPSCKRGK